MTPVLFILAFFTHSCQSVSFFLSLYQGKLNIVPGRITTVVPEENLGCFHKHQNIFCSNKRARFSRDQRAFPFVYSVPYLYRSFHIHLSLRHTHIRYHYLTLFYYFRFIFLFLRSNLTISLYICLSLITHFLTDIITCFALNWFKPAISSLFSQPLALLYH